MEEVKKSARSTGNGKNVEAGFVSGIVRQCLKSKGVAAKLRRGDNPATEYQSWEILAAYGVDLEKTDQRLPFLTIAAAIAKSKDPKNGTMTLGGALAASFHEQGAKDQAKARLRRLLACADLPEVCRILRPMLSLIDSKTSQPLDYSRLLGQLRGFHFNSQQVKAQWAQEFYSNIAEEGKEEANH
jgi:CRISPR system Cascade subunit CasB